MMEKVKELARELNQDRARILSRGQLINLSIVILALADVAERVEILKMCIKNDGSRFNIAQEDGCLWHHVMPCVTALTTADEEIAKILGEKESYPPCIEGKNHRFDDGGECVDCGVVEHEEADPHGKGGFE